MLLGNDPETADVYLQVIQGATFVVKVLTFGCSLSEVCNACEVLKPIRNSSSG